MNQKRVVPLLALLLWVCMIFGHSLQPADASTQESDAVRKLLSWLFRHDFSSFFVRKLAHFTEFFILGVLAVWFFAAGTVRTLSACLRSIPFGMTTALCDETIQLFVAGREGRLQDVWLDCSGAAAGAACLGALLHFVRKRRSSAGGEHAAGGR